MTLVLVVICLIRAKVSAFVEFQNNKHCEKVTQFVLIWIELRTNKGRTLAVWALFAAAALNVIISTSFA